MNKKSSYASSLILAFTIFFANPAAPQIPDFAKIYWADGGSWKIQRANIDGSNIEYIRALGACGSLSTIAVDTIARKIYWAEQNCYKMYQANLDGSKENSLLTGNSSMEMELDLINGKIYRGEFFGEIVRTNLDGSSPDTLYTSSNAIEDIALDLAGGKIYWTSFSDRTIRRANLDGSNVERLLTAADPRGIALDIAAGKMYWTDDDSIAAVRRCNLDGTQIDTLVSGGLDFPIAIALDLEAGQMYWSDIGTNKIQRANLDGSNVADIVQNVNAYGLAFDFTPRRAALPVEMVAFSANFDPANNAVLLQWQTATETNNFGFDIERSMPGVENAWQKIGFAPGHGTSIQPHFYRFSDNLANEINTERQDLTYRLRQIDTDGTFEYSQELTVSLSGRPSVFALHPNFPNPFNPETRIKYDIATRSAVKLDIFNIVGQRVATLVDAEQDAGTQIRTWHPTTDFASGSYMVRLQVQPRDGSTGFTRVRRMTLSK